MLTLNKKVSEIKELFNSDVDSEEEAIALFKKIGYLEGECVAIVLGTNNNESTPLMKALSEYDDEVEMITVVLKNLWKGFEAGFHGQESWTFSGECMVGDWKNDLKEFIEAFENMVDGEDFVSSIIKLIAHGRNLFENVMRECDARATEGELIKYCYDSDGCGITTLVMRATANL